MFVALRTGPEMPSLFRRCVREKGVIVETLVFGPDEPLELDKAQVDVVREDIGTVLVIVRPRLKADGEEYRYEPDWYATQRFGRQVAEELVKAAEKQNVAPNLKPFHVKCLEIDMKDLEKREAAAKERAEKTEDPEANQEVDAVDSIALANQAELAEAFGVEDEVVKSWQKAGLKKNGNHYDSLEVFDFISGAGLIGRDVTEIYPEAVESDMKVFDTDGILEVYTSIGIPLRTEEPLTGETIEDFLANLDEVLGLDAK